MNTLSCSLNTEIESLCGMAVNGMRPRRHVMALLLLERGKVRERTYLPTSWPCAEFNLHSSQPAALDYRPHLLNPETMALF